MNLLDDQSCALTLQQITMGCKGERGLNSMASLSRLGRLPRRFGTVTTQTRDAHPALMALRGGKLMPVL